jgi:hypothetical protein
MLLKLVLLVLGDERIWLREYACDVYDEFAMYVVSVDNIGPSFPINNEKKRKQISNIKWGKDKPSCCYSMIED